MICISEKCCCKWLVWHYHFCLKMAAKFLGLMGSKKNITALKPPTNYHNRPTRSECAKNMKCLFHIATNTYYVHPQKEVTPWPINWSSQPLNLCPPRHLTLLFITSVNHFKLNRRKNESNLFYIKYNLHKLFKL